MKETIRFVISFCLLAVMLGFASSAALACGPFIVSPIFSLETHPDFPLEPYIKGKAGIVPESFGDLSLIPFYRQLNGVSFSAAEQKLVKTALDNEIFYRQGFNDAQEPRREGVPDYVDGWLVARAALTGEKRDIETDRRVTDGYNYYNNCLADSFRTATKTLEARIAAHGKGDLVRDWLKGQDLVFSNCGEGAAMPPDAPADAPEWLRKDREYQYAAALMYSGSPDESRVRFERIAADKSSPWQATARFVVARTLIRQAGSGDVVEAATDTAEIEKKTRDLYRKASEKLEEIIGDPSMIDFHASAIRLLGLVKYRSTPVERQKELAGILASGRDNPNIYDDLNDYSWLTGHIATRAEANGSTIDAEEAEKAGKTYDYNYQLKLRDVPESDRSEDLTDWLFTCRAVDGFEHALERWQATRKLHWFVAAISKAQGNDADSLLVEASRLSSDSPAFFTVRYHEVRLLLASGKRAGAKSKLDEILGRGFESLSRSTQNRFLAERMAVAANLEEFLKYAQRKAAIFDWNDTGREEGTDLKDDVRLRPWIDRPMFDDDAVAFLNEKVPLSTLRAAALSPQLPVHLKKFLVSAVWVRAYALGDGAILREFGPLVARSAPEFAPYVSKYAAARGGVNQEAAALLAIVRYPVMQPYVPVGFGREDSAATTIDSIRGNWWCVEPRRSELGGQYNENFTYPAVYPEFLSPDETGRAAAEQKLLAEFGNSSTGLARRAVLFANANQKHPQVAEILHFAVRATRYGCTDDDTGRYSKEAFDILRKRYPRSPWTKQTPYWFGGN